MEPNQEVLSLDDMIAVCLSELDNETPGTEEYKDILSNLVELYRLRNEEQKIDNAYAMEFAKFEANRELDKLKYEDEKKLSTMKFEAERADKEAEEMRERDKIFSDKLKVGVSAGISILGISTLVYLSLRTMKFEETGVIRSKAMPKLADVMKFIKI